MRADDGCVLVLAGSILGWASGGWFEHDFASDFFGTLVAEQFVWPPDTLTLSSVLIALEHGDDSYVKRLYYQYQRNKPPTYFS